MNQQEHTTVSIRLMDKEYSINCPTDARAELQTAAEYLNEKMLELRTGGKLIGLDRIAVMAALTISHELIQERAEKTHNLEQRVEQLSLKIDNALKRESQSSTHGND